jgi:type IV pilus assembly protein PilW
MIRSRIKQLGLSLIELMVAILIGLIILVGVVQVVISSKTSFLGQEEMSFIQENSRYAIEVIGRDIQNAGYWGCAGSGAKVALVARVNETDAADFLGVDTPLVGLKGYEGGDASAAKTEPNSFQSEVLITSKDKNGKSLLPDTILLRSFVNEPIAIASHASDRTITLNADHKFEGADYVGVVAEDCQRVGIFRAAATTAKGKVIQYNEDSTNGNHIEVIKPSTESSILCKGINICSSDVPGQLYSNASVVMPFQSRAYFIGRSESTNMPALKRAALSNTGSSRTEEVALGIENMQILYGVNNGNNIQFFKADAVSATNWGNVTTVQVSLVFRSQSPMLPADQESTLLGHTFKDRYARQLVTSTFRIRNRI